MKKLTKRVKTLLATSVAMLGCVIGGAFAVQSVNEVVHAETIGSYVELFTPTANTTEFGSVTSGGDYLTASLADNAKTETGKAVALTYTPSSTTANYVLSTTSSETAKAEGVALWLDIPAATTDIYSFSLSIVNGAYSSSWQNMGVGQELVLINYADRTVETRTSAWKKSELERFLRLANDTSYCVL